MIYKKSIDGYQQVLHGIKQKTLVYGEKMLLTEFIMDQGSQLPPHAHPHEQTGYLISGLIRLTIGNDSKEVSPGESWSVPSNEVHQAEILADSVAIEVFSPVREDYLPNRTQ